MHTHGCILMDVCTYADAHSCMLRRMHTHNCQACQDTKAFSEPPVLSCLSAFVQLLFLGLFRSYSFLWLLPRTHHLQDTVSVLTTLQTEPGGLFSGCLSCLCLPPTLGSYSSTTCVPSQHLRAFLEHNQCSKE